MTTPSVATSAADAPPLTSRERAAGSHTLVADDTEEQVTPLI
ncbi:hypothetical protein ACWC10_06075 [Streptomyces sp. NPDC001595]